jgi:membrane protein YdbS with pleckstrin-like domain
MALVDTEETEVIGEAHWNIFLPTVTFAAVFIVLWGLLDLFDRGHTVPARFAFLVAVLATPLLLLLSFLRYQTTRISRSFDGVWVETGWPNMSPRHIAFTDIEAIDTASPPVSGRFGAGDLTLSLRSGDRVTVRSLADVEAVASRIRPPARPAQE